jgi:two-component system LytT family response regulator
VKTYVSMFLCGSKQKKNMLKAIIIDDEPYCCEILAAMLESDCPDVEVISICSNASEGLAAIRQHSPDLVFLDVEMPKMNGFEMLEQLASINFHLIFTTSYDQYALKAIRFSAIDYLLKPIDREELNKAIQKVKDRFQITIPQQLEILMEKLKQSSSPVSKIALPTMEGLQMIPIENIVSCESDDNYTNIKLKTGKKLLVTRSLKEIEETLEQHSFIRVHRSYLVNLNEIEKYIKGEGGYLVMSDGTSIDVARNKKEVLLKKLLPYKE